MSSRADAPVNVPVEDVRDLLMRLLASKSLFKFDAEIVAQRLIDADLRGAHAYGTAMMLRILEALAAGDVDPRGRVLTLHETPALGILDGSRAIGAVAATKGMQMAVAKARESGVGTVVVGNSQTLGAASVYALLAAREGMIGFVTSSSGGATVAAPGSMQGAVGNSPVAWAVPITGRAPFVVDFSCGALSWSDVEAARAAGGRLPANSALDAQGQPTTDPGQAVTLLPMGGPRGFGLSFVCSVLAGALAGGRLPIRKKRSASAEDSQHFFQAIDPAAFADPAKFAKELATSMDEIRGLPVAGDAESLRFPGDEDERRAARIQSEGIPLAASVYEQLGKAAPGGWKSASSGGT